MSTSTRLQIRRLRVWQTLVPRVAIVVLCQHALPAAQRPHPPVQLALTHVNVIDVTRGSVNADMTVLLADGRVQELFKAGSNKLPPTAHAIDASGKFLIPGLWD